MNFALKIKTTNGEQVLKSLAPTSTVLELKTELASIGNIHIDRLHVLVGFPPKALDLSRDTAALSDVGILSGDTLIVDEKTVVCDSKPVETKSEPEVARAHISEEGLDCPGILMKYVVPADNSCLFSSIYYVLNGKVDSSGTIAPLMRQMVAEKISNDSEMFTEAILGKPNTEYCNWIQNDNSWGGAIELAVLSNHHGVEITVVDTVNAILNRFGEDQKYQFRVFLMFDGIHYDPLYLEPFDGGKIQTIFPINNESILRDAEQLAKEAQSSRQYTDVNKFTLKCLVCNISIKGQVEAQQHAQSTGHQNFGEI